VENGIVRLSLDPAHVHLLGKERQQALEQALCDYFGRRVKLTIVRDKPLARETPARQQLRQQDERQRQAVDTIDKDANVKAILDAFGGSVQPDSVRPRD
jgi:hypothetical protein